MTMVEFNAKLATADNLQLEKDAYELAVQMAKDTNKCKCVEKCKCGAKFVKAFTNALYGHNWGV